MQLIYFKKDLEAMGSNFNDKTQEQAIYSDCYKTDIIRLSRSPYYGWNIFFSLRSFVTILLSLGSTVTKPSTLNYEM